MSDGTFAVLVGQDCDFIVRGPNVNRNAKYAELLKAEFIPQYNREKLKKGLKTLEFSYFYPETNEDATTGVL
ncbi:hypothetical protein, partial [Bacillus cereus]